MSGLSFTAAFEDESTAVQFLAYWLSVPGRSYEGASVPLRYRFSPCTPEGERVSLVELNALLNKPITLVAMGRTETR